MSALPRRMPEPPRLDPALDKNARLGLALQNLKQGECLPGPLAPYTSLIAMAYRKELPKRNQPWQSRLCDGEGKPVRHGANLWDPNSIVYYRATDVLVLMEIDDPENAIPFKIADLHQIRSELAPIVQAMKDYFAVVGPWEKALLPIVID